MGCSPLNVALRAVCGERASFYSDAIGISERAMLLGIRTGTASDLTLPDGRFALRRVRPNGSHRSPVRYIHDNLDRPLSVAEIAGRISCIATPSNTIIGRFTRVSPRDEDYIERARIDRCGESDCARTTTPIKAIADRVSCRNGPAISLRAFTQDREKPPGAFSQQAAHCQQVPIRNPQDHWSKDHPSAYCGSAITCGKHPTYSAPAALWDQVRLSRTVPTSYACPSAEHYTG